jgi:CRISPR-associated protein Cmr6
MPENGFCPLCREAASSRPWEQADKANRGLLFDKFGSAWREIPGRNHRENECRYEFDKAGAGTWLEGVTRSLWSQEGQLKAALARRSRLVAAMGGLVLCVKNASRFVAGMGREHPLENGFAWHHTLGVPYLPGSSVKGVLRSFYREEYGKLIKTRDQETREYREKWEENEETGKVFGSQEAVGKYIFLDMLPVEPPELVVDVMTPHYGPYYSKKETPGDWHSPVPIKFLTVEEGYLWHLAIIPGTGVEDYSIHGLEQLRDNLYNALDHSGAGAKTAIGYGRMVRHKELIQVWEDETMKEREKQEEEDREREFLENETSVGKQLYALAKSNKGQEPYVTWYQELLHGRFLNSPRAERIEVANRVKAKMQEKKKWKTRTSKKNPLTDKAYTRTRDIMNILGEANSE